MSRAAGHDKLVHKALDTLRRVNEPATLYVVVEGHLYLNTTIHNSGRTNLGNLGQMCKLATHLCRWSKDSMAHGGPRRIKESNEAATPPYSEPGTGEPDDKSVRSEMDEHKPPPEYRYRRADWFIPGRLFHIWADKDVEIHQKRFVLLDTKNIEGPGLLVRVYEEQEEAEANKGYFHRSHVLVKSFEPATARPDDRRGRSRRKTVFMDEYVEERVDERTYIELEHQYNIPFEKYPCVDGGVLDMHSLNHLRRYYIEWLIYHWNLEEIPTPSGLSNVSISSAFNPRR